MAEKIRKGFSKGGIMPLEKRDSPKDELFPQPEYLKKYFNTVSNFGLYFQKFCRYQKDGLKLQAQHSWNNGQKGKDRIDYEWSLLENQKAHAEKMLRNSLSMLSKLHERQTLCLESYAELGSETLEISAISETPLLTGIGETSPTEVGMVFDRNMGIPYLPASSIKGAVRYAYCVNFANKNPDKISYDKADSKKDGIIEEKDVKGLVELFGGTDAKDAKRGGFAFMDAYSESVPTLKVDIMNPHHGSYYQNKTTDGPVETELPIPIKFLVVEKGLTYKFRGFFINKDAEKYKDQLIEAFKTAMTLLGLGAKTAVGYGRFNFKNGDVLHTEYFKQKAQKRTQERKREEEQNRQAKLDQKERERKAKEAQEAEDKKKTEAEKQKQEAEALRQEQAAQEAAEAEAIEKALENAEGIDKDILLMKKELDMNKATTYYLKYLEKKDTFNEKEKELALLIQIQFNKLDKNAKRDKLARRDRLNKIIKKL